MSEPASKKAKTGEVTITAAEVVDLRVPTSDNMLGSDPFHKEPDYSSAVLHLDTSSGVRGVSVVFTIGAGTDWMCYGIKDLTQMVVGMKLSEFTSNPIHIYRRLIDHHQARWLHDGVFRMACGSILNALWDIWAKTENKPMWKLLTDLEPEFIVHKCIDWRNIQDALSKEEALTILRNGAKNKAKREVEMATQGPKAYCTAGWLGLSNDQILGTIKKLTGSGFDSFKLKVGRNLEADVARIKHMREAIGDSFNLMVDANQYWGVNQAKEHMEHYKPYGLKWVEEPIARDDVLGYVELQEEFKDASFQMACGEQAASPVIFKQLLKSGAIGYCQIDSCRVAGVNDVMAIILMAAKYNVPVCPHGGGIALCNLIQHYGMWDQVAVAGHSNTQLVEYIDFLGEAQLYPVKTINGHYATPTQPGWGLEFNQQFLIDHTYPTGKMWKDRPKNKCGIHYECDHNTE